ncbi:hypothetical protein BOV97_12795 [Solemya velum gill symbiont]|nr:hypothetical protein BOV97_12795 [Solemya velum gill symbiont]
MPTYMEKKRKINDTDILESTLPSPISQIWTKFLVMIAYIPEDGTPTHNPLNKLSPFVVQKTNYFTTQETHPKEL